MSGLVAYAIGSAVIGLALCIPGTTTTTMSQDPDPDRRWAETVGVEMRQAVLESVDAYLADPDSHAPVCWEDEAIVVVLDHAHPDYGNTAPPQVGLVGCVPLDNLPVSGNRPQG